MYSAPATNAAAVPTPATNRIAIANHASFQPSAAAEATATIARPVAPTSRAPSRSLSRPIGTCSAACVTKSAVVKSPTTARPMPYDDATRSATAPTFATLNPAVNASAPPPIAACSLTVAFRIAFGELFFEADRDGESVARDRAAPPGGARGGRPRRVVPARRDEPRLRPV